VGLRQLGCNVPVLDVAGGLGVAHDGSQTNFHSPLNYSTHE